MKIKSIQYSDSREYMEYGLKRWRKAGIEVGLSENETPEEGYKYAKEQVEKTLNDNPPIPLPIVDLSSPPISTSNIPLSPKERKEQAIQNTIIQIKEIKDIGVLKTFEKLASANPSTKEAFDNRLKELVG